MRCSKGVSSVAGTNLAAYTKVPGSSPDGAGLFSLFFVITFENDAVVNNLVHRMIGTNCSIFKFINKQTLVTKNESESWPVHNESETKTQKFHNETETNAK